MNTALESAIQPLLHSPLLREIVDTLQARIRQEAARRREFYEDLRDDQKADPGFRRRSQEQWGPGTKVAEKAPDAFERVEFVLYSGLSLLEADKELTLNAAFTVETTAPGLFLVRSPHKLYEFRLLLHSG